MPTILHRYPIRPSADICWNCLTIWTKTGNMDDRTSTKRQRDETGKTPDEVKRIKRETRTEAEKDSSQLPSSSPLTKINITNQVDIIVINCEFDECCK